MSSTTPASNGERNYVMRDGRKVYTTDAPEFTGEQKLAEFEKVRDLLKFADIDARYARWDLASPGFNCEGDLIGSYAVLGEHAKYQYVLFRIPGWEGDRTVLDSE